MSKETEQPPALNRRGMRGGRPNFLARSATDDAAQLDRRSSLMPDTRGSQDALDASGFHSERTPSNPYEPNDENSEPEPRKHTLTNRIFQVFEDRFGGLYKRQESDRDQPKLHRRHRVSTDNLLSAHAHGRMIHDGKTEEHRGQKKGSMPRPIGGSEKLGTFSGVFVPTSLNVLSILMFLRFGFILGQSGFLGMMGMLIISYLINLITTLSISAIASNGTVRGGGAYYLISRSLGPEFGGSIGVVFYLGFVFNTGMNAVGLIDCFRQNFGKQSGNWYNWLPEDGWWTYLWATIVLVICTGICLAGSSIFARASNGLLAILLVATFSIPLSALILQPFSRMGIEYTGISAKTFMGNLKPQFTRKAAGSRIHGKENFQDLFGILFPATGGIFAGASMSGDLKHPSKAIPKGTLAGLALTFFAYTIVILAMAATITRVSFYKNVNVIQDTNLSAVLILLGEFATTFFSSLMGVIGSAKLLQALARDNLLPGFGIFGQGTTVGDEPTYAIIFTYIIAQLTMLFDINQIASFITMTYLMTFLVTNLACFLLKLGSAPNFRPSFHFFNSWTAGVGTVISGATMFFVDGLYATGCVGILVVIFLIIHYTTPPKSWGDVSQSLIYHQVRKYLLRLRQEHVKFWRPQILLFVNDPRRQYKLIRFCNSMKKGALYVLGHVIVTQDFAGAVPEARRQQAAWKKYIDFSKCKAFVNIAISPAVEWGTRNIVLGAGLGGMRPNIAVMGFFNLEEWRKSIPLVDVSDTKPTGEEDEGHNGGSRASPRSRKSNGNRHHRRLSAEIKLDGLLPTDTCRTEGAMSARDYVTILEDLLLRLQINVAVAKGFQELEFPDPKGENKKKYIDLWPIQMSAEVPSAGVHQPNVMTTNFDTYTLILQLGCILNTVPAYKKVYKLRVAVFVEYETDVEEERGRVKSLLENLRIEAEILVFWLAAGDLPGYEIIVNGATGDDETMSTINKALEDEEWWGEMQRLRGTRGNTTASQDLETHERIPDPKNQGFRIHEWERFEGLKRMLRRSKKRHTMSSLNRFGVSLFMRTHRLQQQEVSQHPSHNSASEDSESSDDSDYTLDGEDTASDAAVSAASENDLDDFVVEDDVENSNLKTINRRRSHGDSLGGPSLSKKPPFVPSTLQTSKPDKAPSEDDVPGSLPSEGAGKPSLEAPNQRPRPNRQSSMAKFSSKPVPKTTVATEDGPGPSIMFSDDPSTPPLPEAKSQHQSTIKFGGDNRPKSQDLSASVESTDSLASGYPSSQSIPLSFNDLPCRAQHLILNQLIRKQSDLTAVVFTTLPSPLEGTCETEENSVGYLSDLEYLCDRLPPILLVHSNSMTVTMNL